MANIICINCMKGTLNTNGVCHVCGKSDEEIKTSRRHLPLRTILRGKYLIGKVIGEGGFGITYLGYDLDLEIRVAIKEFCPREFAGRDAGDGLTMHPFDKESADFFRTEKEKFINEAKRLARFRGNPGIVSVLDYFQENETAYIVMEYIEGVTLKAFHKATGKTMEPETALSLMKPVIESLSEIHKEGIIHRDISPDNIMIDGKNQKVYLIDFGTAREVQEKEEQSLSVYKKGDYTPIEQQSRHGKQGPWTDVYALCATIYRCITGITPPAAIDRMVQETIVKPSDMGIKISLRMENALMHGLAVKWEERIRSMEQLLEELEDDFATEAYTDIDTIIEPAANDRNNEDEIVILPTALPKEDEFSKKLAEAEKKYNNIKGYKSLAVVATILTTLILLIVYIALIGEGKEVNALAFVAGILCLPLIYVSKKNSANKVFLNELFPNIITENILYQQIHYIGKNVNSTTPKGYIGNHKIPRRFMEDYYSRVISASSGISETVKKAWKDTVKRKLKNT